jgi:hypothetical protein
MRLLTTSNLELVEFRPHEIPPYAVLSHTWGKHEVLLQDMVNQSAQRKPSFAKVRSAVHQARKDGLEYVWVDNCCIDKSSSAELSESLNSMYAWYQNAAICYAYLSDVTADIDVTDSDSEFARSLWFTRGFTLQELLAPAQVVFFSRDWIAIGSKIELQESLSTITGISVQYLCHQEPIFSACIAERMSWAAKRQTSRPEDVAYCLLGIFNVNMPLLYGEGEEKAFIRLQEEIMRQSDDHSIFAWREDAPSDTLHGLLAPTPRRFALSQDIFPYENWEVLPPHTMTNRGLRIDLRLVKSPHERDIYIAALNCPMPPVFADNTFVGIYLKKLSSGDEQYARVRAHDFIEFHTPRADLQTIFVRQMVRSVPEVHRALFPYHRFHLREGPHPSGGYRIVDTFPRSLSNMKQFGELSTDSAPTPEFIKSSNEAVRKWANTSHRRSFPIQKSPKRLSGVVLFKRDPSDKMLCVMLGSLGRFNAGVDVSEISSDFISGKLEDQLMEGFQQSFDPKPPGQVLTFAKHFVLASIETRVHHGVKWHIIDLQVQHAEDSLAIGDIRQPKETLRIDAIELAQPRCKTNQQVSQPRGPKFQTRSYPPASRHKMPVTSNSHESPKKKDSKRNAPLTGIALGGLVGGFVGLDAGAGTGDGGNGGGGCG